MNTRHRIQKTRNFVAKALPRVSGSGVHEKSMKAQRRDDKIMLKSASEPDDDETKYHLDYEGNYLLDEDGEKIPAHICICAAWDESECVCGAWGREFPDPFEN